MGSEEITSGPRHLLAFQFVPESGQGQHPYGNIAFRYFLPGKVRKYTKDGRLRLRAHDLQTGICFLSLEVDIPRVGSAIPITHLNVFGMFFDGQVHSPNSVLRMGGPGIGGRFPSSWENDGNEPIRLPNAAILDPARAWLLMKYWEATPQPYGEGRIWRRRPPCVTLSVWFAPEYLREFVARQEEKVAA